MMRIFTPACLVLLVALPLSASRASDSDNIRACVSAVKAFTGYLVDEFDARYNGNYFSMSEVSWTEITCRVKLATVWDLKVRGKKYIVDRWAGENAKRTFETLSRETQETIDLLESRKSILQERLSTVEDRLRSPRPNMRSVKAYIREGIYKATGNRL